MPVIRAIDKLEDILASSENFLQRMHELGQDPHRNKQLRRLFSPSEAAEMVGRDRTTLVRAEAELGFQDMARNPNNNRRVGYTLEQIQAFRGHFGTLPGRDPATDAPMVIAIQNFKGGVGKSTTCVNFAHYLGLKGYRVLVVDADSQATTTSMFGYVPDADIEADQTVLPYLVGEQSNLAYAIRRAAFFSELRQGIETVMADYDIVLIDSPPALGTISISVLLAADALMVPSAAKMFDFASTVQFFRMIHTYIERIDPNKSYRWISVLTTLFDQRYESQKQFVEVMRQCFGESVFQRVFFHSSEVINTAVQFNTPYEQEKPRREVLKMMDHVFGEAELAILREWPSKRAQLNEQGVAA